MNNRLLIFLIILFLSTCASDQSTGLMEVKYTNPILSGFYPDPSICRAGSDYYIVNSTFAYFPGITVFHSKDLVNWDLIGHVLNRPEQMNTIGLGVSRGIFAPTIKYNGGLFYVTCTLVDAGGNFVCTATDPEGPWSNPVWLPRINGIDPSLFFDQNGKAYILYNSVAPDDKPLYQGHRTIRMTEFDIEKLEMIGEEVILINGGVDLSKKPIWIEAPHIIQKDGFYYLIPAEGGTAEDHSEVVFRSKEVFGPYIPYKENPILTQRHLDPKRENPITCTGHAELVMTETGDWWAIFLGCRPYRPAVKNYYNTGRETFMTPVKWIDGWPIINPDFENVQYSYSIKIQPGKKTLNWSYSGNFCNRDDFESENLNLNWMFLRTPFEKWFDLNARKGYLGIKLKPETCAGTGNPAFIARRQQHIKGSASTLLDFYPLSEKEKAGLLVFQNENHYYFLCKSIEKNITTVQLYRSGVKEPLMELINSDNLSKDQSDGELYLKIDSDADGYSFYYGFDPDEWILLAEKIDASFLSTKVAGGFVGCVYAMYATSSSNASNNMAYYNWFEYLGDDEVYKN